jgi:hypothetical protein
MYLHLVPIAKQCQRQVATIEPRTQYLNSHDAIVLSYKSRVNSYLYAPHNVTYTAHYNMTKPTLALIDHSFHQKTQSSHFLRAILKETFDVHEYWDESWRGGPRVPVVELNKHDYVFFFQLISPLSDLKKITVPIIWTPLYDSFKPSYTFLTSLSYLNVKILSFSTHVANITARFGIPTFSVQYYYLSPTRALPVQGNHLLFWYRGGIEFNDLKPILDPDQIDSFTILEIPDKDGTKVKLSGEDIARYKITYLTEDFLPRERYLSLLEKASVFIAPRKQEGIGAFTEALAFGKCVIAYNDAVHNEYITHGVDGFLFDATTPPLDLREVPTLSKNAFARAVQNDARWLNDKAAIVPFMLAPHTSVHRLPLFLLWATLNRVARLVHKIRYYVSTRVRK